MRVIETEVKQERMDRHSLVGKRSGIVLISVPPFIRVSSYLRGLKTDILSPRPAYLLGISIRCLLCLYHSIETRVTMTNFSLGSSQVTSSNHAANAVFARRKKVVYFTL